MKIRSTETSLQRRSSKNSKVLSEPVDPHVALASTYYFPLAPRASVGEKQSRHLSFSAQGPPRGSSSHASRVHVKRRVKRHNISPEHAVEVRVRVRVRARARARVRV